MDDHQISSDTLEIVYQRLTRLVHMLPKHWEEDWSSMVEQHQAYVSAVMTRKRDGFCLRLTASRPDRCAAHIVWPAKLDGTRMSAADWRILAPGVAEPAISTLTLSYSEPVIAHRLRRHIVDPGGPLYAQAIERRNTTADRSATITRTTDLIAATFGTTSIPTGPDERAVHLVFGEGKPAVSFKVNAQGVALSLQSPSHAMAAPLARFIRDLARRHP